MCNLAEDSWYRYWTVNRLHNGVQLLDLKLVSEVEVHKFLSLMPTKSSTIYFIPMSLVMKCDDVFSPVIDHLANLSFLEGRFPTKFKVAQLLHI